MAKGTWDILADIFHDNKRARFISLKAELRSLKLASLGSPLSNEDVVNTVLEGLPAKYDYVYGIIVHQEPFPDLKTVRSMLTTEEMRLKSRAPTTSFDSTSSPMVLLANFGNSTRRSNVTTKKKILESPWGSPIPIGDGDGDVKQFLDGNGGGDRE
ncbi:hypothetical protein Tco_0942154 [Tanacetum coccineum]